MCITECILWILWSSSYFVFISPGCNTSGTSCTTSLGTFLHRGLQYLSQLLLSLWAWFSHWGWCRQASSMWSTMRYSGVCFLRSYVLKPTMEMLCFVFDLLLTLLLLMLLCSYILVAISRVKCTRHWGHGHQTVILLHLCALHRERREGWTR